MTDRLSAYGPRLMVAALVLGAAAFYRPQSYGMFADQATYYLQANSLAFDGDLQFDQRDLERFRRHGWPEKAPYGLLLREAGGRFYYSKPFLYSLAAVPFVWVAPVRGPIFLNALLFFLLMEITFRWYRRFNPSRRAAIVAVLVWVASAAPFSIFVLHTDLMVPTLLALALYLWLVGQVGNLSPESSQKPAGPVGNLSYGRIVLSGVFFGLAGYEKNPLIFFCAAVVASLLVQRQWRAAGLLVLASGIVFLLPTAVHVAQDGHFSPYQGRRVYCDDTFPFDHLDQARDRLSAHQAPGSEFFEARLGRELLQPARIRRFLVELPTKIGSFLVGRKTGLFPYLTPALIALALWLGLRPWRERGWASLWIAAALAVYFLFYFFVLRAYYGGATTIGNRYALQVFPAFLLLVRRFPHPPLGFTALVAALVGAGLFFPGYDLLTPYGKVRDNYDLFLKPRFRWLPFEWHLAFFVPDKPYAVIGLGDLGKVLRLTDWNPTNKVEGYFTGSGYHEVAVLSFVPLETVPLRLAARSQPQSGWIRSNGRRRAFSLAPYETRVVQVPLTLRDFAAYPRIRIYCYPLELVTTSPLEPNTIYPASYYARMGPFVQWHTSSRPTSPSVSVVPDDPRDAAQLLWGWHAPEPSDGQGMRQRWAGEATESALILSVSQPRDYVLRVAAESPVAMETEVVWNGRPLDKWFIGPGKGTFSRRIAAAEVRAGDNVLCLRHQWLYQPHAVFEAVPESDTRWLAVHYLRFELDPAP